MRKIPATMATQHPDNAFAPFWDEYKNPFVGVYKEIEEAVTCFDRLGVSEFMWDWEGKHADAAVIDKLFSDYHSYFVRNQLNRDKFLTFRLPNIWEEKGYSLIQAMTVILAAEDFARDLGFDNRPLFEVILPMTQRAEQLMHMHELFEKLANFKSKEFTINEPVNQKNIELIPLVESVESQQTTSKLLKEYLDLYKKHYGQNPTYIRPFFARSDPALASGMLATVLANKIALSQSYKFSQETHVPVFPISGVGSLPFRGGLTPYSIDSYLEEYPGMRTVSIQSSFRYDHPLAKVKSSIKQLEKRLHRTDPKIFNKETEQALIKISKKSEQYYQSTMSKIVRDLQEVFTSVPKRRERRQHIGLLGYGRKMGTHKMPRAITFTAGFYSLGIPPEFIGLGRMLKALNDKQLKLLNKEYKNIRKDIKQAGRYLNKYNLERLIKQNPSWEEIQKDVELTEEILEITLEPKTFEEQAHRNLTSSLILLRNKPGEKLTNLIAETARLRRSLG